MNDVEKALDKLYEELSTEAIETIIRRLPEAKFDEERAKRVAKKLVEVLDGLINALLRINAVPIGKELADAALEFLRKYEGREFRVYEAYVYYFLAELGIDRPKNLERAFSLLLENRVDNELYAYVASRVGISLMKRYEVNGMITKAKETAEKIVSALSGLERYLEGDSNLLVFAARAIDVGFEDTERLRSMLERLGFISGDRLMVPSFVAAVFLKDMMMLAKRLGLKFPR